MSWRTRAERILDVVLRVPSLFVMDSILNGSFLNFCLRYDPTMGWEHYLLWLSGMFIFFLLSCVMFCLDVKQLMEVYSYLLSFGILMISHWWNLNYVLESYAKEIEDLPYFKPRNALQLLTDDPYSFTSNAFCQISLSHLFIVLRTNRHSYRQIENNNSMRLLIQLGIHLSLTFPLTLRAFYQDMHLYLWSPFLSLVIPILQLLTDLYNSLYFIFVTVKRAYSIAITTVQVAGIQNFVEIQWQRLNVPTVLRLFFLCRFTYHLVSHILFSVYQNYLHTGVPDYFQWNISYEVAQHVLIRSCETLIALLGLTSVVSIVTHYIGIFMAYCVGSETEEDRNMGTVSAILFFILALQTGLTGLDPEKRLVRLYRNFCLLSTAILHFVHNMVNPLLMSLSASRSTNITRHLRALGMCVFLIVFPVWLLCYLWSHHTVSTWLLAVTAFSIEVVIKVFISLLVYVLFIVDAYRDTFWEKLDDYVYYVQSTGNTIEFLFGIFLFCNGGWIMMFESGGAIRAVMMCIHAYFNIWVQAKEGWKVFMKRRTAVNKINSLPIATQEQLECLNDVCAICYQELTSARVTRCQHYFHGVCLRKWLYVQDRCPLCHELIYNPDQLQSATESQENPAQQNHVEQPQGQGQPQEVFQPLQNHVEQPQRNPEIYPGPAPNNQAHLHQD